MNATPRQGGPGQPIFILQIEHSGTYGGEILGAYACLDSAFRIADLDAQTRPRILSRYRKQVVLDWSGSSPAWSAIGLSGVVYRILQRTLEP